MGQNFIGPDVRCLFGPAPIRILTITADPNPARADRMHMISYNGRILYEGATQLFLNVIFNYLM